MQLTPTPTYEWAVAHRIPVLTPPRIDDDIIREVEAAGAQYALVVAYGKILPQTLIDIFPQGILNIHYSLLPKYRGASPVEAALLAGDTTTGVAIQRRVYELDAGDVLALEEVPIESAETTRELRPRLVRIGAHLLADILPSYLEGTRMASPQDVALVTHCGKIRKEDGELSLSTSALENWNKYRAYAESPGTYFFAEKDGKRIRIKIRTASYDGSLFMPLLVVPEGKNEMDYRILAESGWKSL